jgi:hypothetical protein
MQYHEAKQSSQTSRQFESAILALPFLNNTRNRSGCWESKVRIINLFQSLTEFWDK